MTERQGGSDVRANLTRAERAGDGTYRLTGHKWFFSAPMCDAHLVLAQAAGGLSCFFLPRLLPDGAGNAVRIQRLKDKLGNRSNASAEVEFEGAFAWLLGEEGRGVPIIIEMVQHTRLDCAIGSAGIIRGAVAQALHHAAYRRAFGKPLVEQPLMQNVLADLVLESEAATALALRLARAFEADAPEREAAFARLATPAVKYWLCKRAPAVVAEAMEVLGGNGYVEESVPAADLPRDAAQFDLGRLGQRDVPRRAARGAARDDGSRGACCPSSRVARGAERPAGSSRGGARHNAARPRPRRARRRGASRQHRHGARGGDAVTTRPGADRRRLLRLAARRRLRRRVRRVAGRRGLGDAHRRATRSR